MIIGTKERIMLSEISSRLKKEMLSQSKLISLSIEELEMLLNIITLQYHEIERFNEEILGIKYVENSPPIHKATSAISIESKNSRDYIKVALALETLAYHNKNYLTKPLHNNCTFSEEIQHLLNRALEEKANET